MVICSEIIVSQFYLLRSNASSVVDVVPSKFTVYVYVQTLVRLVLKRRKKINPFQYLFSDSWCKKIFKMPLVKFETKKLCELIDKYSMDKYYLAYNKFMANHLGNGQIALYNLGDTYEHIEEFSSHYASKVEPRGGPLNQRDDAKVEVIESIEDLKGKNAHFYYILDYFRNLLKTNYKGNLEEFIATEFPKLSDGIGDYALHPLIHIGYGYSVKSETMIC